MPLYRIRREVGEISQEDMDASAYRALVCIPQFPGMKWIRSYWDREAGHLHCYYEAPNSKLIEEHARVARLPCNEVREVSEMLPDTYVHG